MAEKSKEMELTVPELMRTLDHEIHDIEQQGFDTITDALLSIRDVLKKILEAHPKINQ